MRMRNLNTALPIALALMVVLAGCGSNQSSSNGQGTTAAASAATLSSAQAIAASSSDGAKVFETNCSSCHGANGQGSPGAFPPLAGNPVVTGDPSKVIHIVKYGLTGKINVAGHPYNGAMPPWGTNLSNEDIAAALTYVRSSWGNKAGAISAAQVAAVKQ
jgi:mono/diheme cytochrome c family protein